MEKVLPLANGRSTTQNFWTGRHFFISFKKGILIPKKIHFTLLPFTQTLIRQPILANKRVIIWVRVKLPFYPFTLLLFS